MKHIHAYAYSHFKGLRSKSAFLINAHKKVPRAFTGLLATL